MTAVLASTMAEKLNFLGPEIALFIATCFCMVLGLSPKRSVRDACPAVAFVALAVAGVIAVVHRPEMPGAPFPGLIPYAKALIAVVGALLVMLVAGTIDREYERRVARGETPFDSITSNRGEFWAFLLFSLTGLMLCTTADDLIWLFLALELTSLPTYVMVSISTPRSRSQEAGVKYFFLGAFGAAIFLYGFALLYGAAGTTLLFAGPGETSIAQVFAQNVAETGSIGPIGTLGIVLAVVGLLFKVAAVPMHFYTPDVYEGAATSVSAFLAFVPKLAGFVALMLVLGAVGWTFGEAGSSLPEPIRVTLWIVAALTMTVGNVLALLQDSVKRMLAYSSVSHSGYMIVGLIAGPGDGSSIASNGLGALLFYMLCYGFMNLGAFAVLACLERISADGSSSEIETVSDLRGLCSTHPLLGWTMTLCAASLLGFPPLLGFFGKFYLFTSAIGAGEIALVVVMGLNSAIAAFYYLRLVATPLLEEADDSTRGLRVTEFPARLVAATLSAVSVVALVPLTSALTRESDRAVRGDAAVEVSGEIPAPALEPARDETAETGG